MSTAMRGAATRADWAACIPHADAMALIARVSHWDDAYICAEADAPGSQHPLARRDGRVHALHACEYGAQAAAVHGALLAQAAAACDARNGVLAALRNVRLHGPWLDPAAPIHIEAWRLAALPQALQYRFVVGQGNGVIAEGQVLIAQ